MWLSEPHFSKKTGNEPSFSQKICSESKFFVKNKTSTMLPQAKHRTVAIKCLI
jgi:hypothetical protein